MVSEAVTQGNPGDSLDEPAAQTNPKIYPTRRPPTRHDPRRAIKDLPAGSVPPGVEIHVTPGPRDQVLVAWRGDRRLTSGIWSVICWVDDTGRIQAELIVRNFARDGLTTVLQLVSEGWTIKKICHRDDA